MGKFFTSTQIYNPKQLDHDAFAASFCKKMKQEGYELCEADCAELSYVLAFADNCKWVTISSEVYEQGNQTSQADTARIARMLGTYCVNTIVIDSDCAMLDLYDDKGKKADTAVMGRADDYFGDDIPEPTKAVWEQFLSAGSTWEQLTAVMQGSYVFVEDGLAELAPMIGMDSRRILFAFENVNENDANVQFLSFKKADSKKEKKLTLESAFIKVFGEGLEALGYKRIKGRYPYLVRNIGDEIFHVITYIEEQSFDPHKKQFMIVGGVATVYRRSIDLSISPKRNTNWLMDNCWIYSRLHSWNNDPQSEFRKFRDQISHFYCSIENEKMEQDMQYAFEITKNIMLPILNNVTDIDSCIEYHHQIGLLLQLFDDSMIPNNNYNEGLLYIKTNDKTIFTERMKNAVSDFAIREKRFFERIYTEPGLYQKIQLELEKRKSSNITRLKSYELL